MKRRVQAGWRKVSGVSCDGGLSGRFKGKVYNMVVRPAVFESVALTKRQEVALEVELKRLRLETRI